MANNLVTRLRDELFYPLESHFNNFFDEFYGNLRSNGFSVDSLKGRIGFPKMDVITDNGKWIVEVHVPGIESENIGVEIIPVDRGRMLKISGHMSQHDYSKEAEWSVKELRRSAFERSIILPDYVEGDPEATYKNGVLKLIWDAPKTEIPERKTVEIKKLE